MTTKSKVKEVARMRVVDGLYMPKGKKMLIIQCSKGHKFQRLNTDRFVKCPECKEKGDLLDIRARDEADLVGTRIWQQG